MKNILIHKFSGLSKILLLFLLVYSCTQDPTLWKVTSQQQVIADFVAANPAKYSEFNKLLVSVNLVDLLKIRGPYTLFLPTNEAMSAYYKLKGISSYTDLTLQQQKELAYNHLIVNSEIHSGDIGLGALRDTNAIGDFMATEFSGSDIIINKHSKITDRDIVCANGYVHQIDQVIEPLKVNIYDMIANNPSYSLFAQGLKRTKISDTLSTVSFLFGRKNARTRFTVLAVPDTIFNRYGIHTIDDLIAHYTDRPDSITFLKNGFYRYMEYHCMANTYFLSGLNTKLYPILSFDNNISMTVDTDYKLNLNKLTKKYTGFNIIASNIPAKNGALHSVNDLLPVTEPDPVTFVFDTTDYFDLKQGDYYGKYYMKWSDGKNTFAKIKWEGDYLQYYYKNHDAPTEVNSDCLQMFGFFWCEITTPKIMKGSYKLSGYLWGKPSFEVYVDGVKSAFVKSTDADVAPWGEFIWPKTQEHKIKIVSMTWGTMFWDTVIFTPIN
ncbi:MAG: fasciclin domain-containing protein [Bacteroidia bacterium]|jgi:uncharacterized surface protein with fasciclin (FAS1) repeats